MFGVLFFVVALNENANGTIGSKLLSSRSCVAPMSRRLHRLRMPIALIGIGAGTRNTMAKLKKCQAVIWEPDMFKHAVSRSVDRLGADPV